jgi:acyl-CoA synthetase (AMP-forming)/AMP-acid ligase II
MQDTLKVSGTQVSPREIEETLLAHPSNLVVDAVVAGVSGGRTVDEKIPRAWVVLGPAAKDLDPQDVVRELEVWCQKSFSKYKWLRGGIQIVDEVRLVCLIVFLVLTLVGLDTQEPDG